MSSNRLLISPHSISEAPPSMSPQRNNQNNPFRTRVKQSNDDTYSSKNLRAIPRPIMSKQLNMTMRSEQLSNQLGINNSNNVKKKKEDFINSENDTTLGRAMTITPNKNNARLLAEICAEAGKLNAEIAKQCSDNTLELREDEHSIAPDVQTQRKLNKICKLVKNECLTNKSLKSCGKCVTFVPFSAGKRSYKRRVQKYGTRTHNTRKHKSTQHKSKKN